MANIKISCPHCKAWFTVSEAYIGKKCRCKQCDKNFVISRPKENRDHSSVAEPKQSEAHATQPIETSTIVRFNWRFNWGQAPIFYPPQLTYLAIPRRGVGFNFSVSVLDFPL